MPPILDAFPFDWSRPAAQALHTALVSLYPQRNGALFVAGKVGIQPFEINVEQPVFYLWRDILDEGARRQQNRAIAKLARDGNPTNPTRSVFDALLADAPVIVEPQRRAADGSAVFIAGDDGVGEKEALLYHDSLLTEIGLVPALLDTLRSMVALAPAVCLLHVYVGGALTLGTAFRIGPDLLLTNHHVLLPYGASPTKIVAEFGFETDSQGNGLASTSLSADVTSVIADATDDWGVVRVAGMKAEWPVVDLHQAVDPVVGEAAYILQHPMGGRKQLGFVRNTVTDYGDQVVHYLTDTQQGSSGSPVFNAAGKLIGLHHVGGSPQEALGKAPVCKNEGIRIPRVLAGLAQHQVALAAV
jgi:S1-C subfamily serine protease